MPEHLLRHLTHEGWRGSAGHARESSSTPWPVRIQIGPAGHHGGDSSTQPVSDAQPADFAEYLIRNGAGDRDRTGDIQLGKLAFYR